MFYKTIEFELKDGRSAAIRSIRPDEAEAVLVCFKNLITQTKFLLLDNEKNVASLERETAYLEGMQSSTTNVQLGLYVDGVIMGLADVHITSDRHERLKHRCGIGVSIDKSLWGLGLGKRMMDAVIDVAQRYGYEQMELQVMADNERAISLYKKYGFEICGTLPDALKDADGTYHDEHTMVKKLTVKFEPEEKATSDLEDWIEEQGIQLRY